MSESAPELPQILGVEAAGEQVALDLAILETLFWFRGHFPGLPVLPGVVLIDWALQFGRHHLGTPAIARELTQIKFRRLLRPGTAVRLVLRRERGGTRLAFAYEAAGAPAASGRIDFPA
jgi:3-hydroxymyristoyl/3-hydroxydecanoyl-(acyl carrier protein) dehydratase